MGALSKHMKRDLHYADFLAFGEEHLVRPENIVDFIHDNLSSGNHETFAYEAYKLILEAQTKEAALNKDKFKCEIENWQSMSNDALRHKLKK